MIHQRSTYSGELLIRSLLLSFFLAACLLKIFLIPGLFQGVLLKHLVLIHGCDTRARKHRLSLAAIAFDGVYGDDHLY